MELASRVDTAALSFTNAMGWNVELARVLVSIGPLAYLEGAPVAQRGPWARGLAMLRRALDVSVAHAHPGHYVGGGTLGEMLVPTSVDLALGPADLGIGNGITGKALSARFSFHAPPVGPYAEALGAHVVAVEGSAIRDGASRWFRALATREDVLDPEGQPQVLGCEFRGSNIDQSGVVTLTIRPEVWLDQSDFAEISESSDGQVVEVDPSLTAHKAFVRGLKKAAGYVFTYAQK